MPDDATPPASTAVAMHQPAVLNGDIFATSTGFAHAQRVAKVFQASSLVPEGLRKNPADVILALAIARRMKEDPVAVMQAIYFVSGRAGFKTEYMISRANQSGVFKHRIRWRREGAGDALKVEAYATLADTGDEVSAEATMAMAMAEGWTRNPKYKTMPEHMLRWRSATMLIRLFAPEVMTGQQTVEELEDVAVAAAPVMRDITPAQPVEQTVEELLSAGEEGATTTADAPGEAADTSQPTSPGDSDAQTVVDAPAREWHATGASNDALLASLLQMVGETTMAADLADIQNTNAALLDKWRKGALGSVYRRHLTTFEAAVKTRADQFAA